MDTSVEFITGPLVVLASLHRTAISLSPPRKNIPCSHRARLQGHPVRQGGATCSLPHHALWALPAEQVDLSQSLLVIALNR